MIKILLPLLIILSLFSHKAFSSEWNRNNLDKPNENFWTDSIENSKLVNRANLYNKLIWFYKNKISPSQGIRCPLYPSCSTFTLYSMNKYGFITGLIMGIDRLYYRENTHSLFKEHLYESYPHKKRRMFFDPPEVNYILKKIDWRFYRYDYYEKFHTNITPVLSDNNKIVKAADYGSKDNTIKTADNNINNNIKYIRKLGKLFKESKRYFLSYTYNLSYYYLEQDPEQKFNAGMDAVESCIINKKTEEGVKLLREMINQFPEKAESLNYYTAYLFLLNKSFAQASLSLESLGNLQIKNEHVDVYNFLKAYSQFGNYKIEYSLNNLEKIDSSFKAYEDVQSIIKDINKEPGYKKKSKIIAFMLSTILPGAGQFYAGAGFDGLNTLFFNLLTGSATYAAWKYELSKSRENRDFILPLASSAVFSLFYVANLYNSINIVNRVNANSQSNYYQSVLSRFNLIINKHSIFVGFNNNI